MQNERNLAVLIVALCSMGRVSQAQSSPSRFYKDIAQSVKLLKGTMYLNLGA